MEVGWAPESVWTFGEDENLLLLTGFEPQIVQSVTVTAPTTLFRIIKYSFSQGKRVFYFVIGRSFFTRGNNFLFNMEGIDRSFDHRHISEF
jgi:hypothetical protein